MIQPEPYSSTERHQLLTAASQGDIHSLQTLLRGADINTVGTWDDDSNEDSDQEGRPQWTMLTIACHHRRLSTVRFLLQKGASINFHPPDGLSALMTAAHQGHDEMFVLLCDAGASIKHKSSEGTSLLHEAVADVSDNNLDGKTIIVTILLKRNFPIDTVDDDGHTALHEAAFIGTLPLVTLLVNGGSDINAENRWGDRPLDKAAMEGRHDVVDFLLSHGAVVNNQEGGCNGLAYAVTNGYRRVVILLLDHGAKTVPDKWPSLLLLCAARSGDACVVDEVARRGWGHQAKDALLDAVQLDTPAVVNFLMFLGLVDVNARNAAGQTLLHLAVLSKQWEISDVYGAMNPRTEVIALLLRRGADVKALNFKGQTAKDLAVAEGYTAAVELLQANEH